MCASDLLFIHSYVIFKSQKYNFCSRASAVIPYWECAVMNVNIVPSFPTIWTCLQPDCDVYSSSRSYYYNKPSNTVQITIYTYLSVGRAYWFIIRASFTYGANKIQLFTLIGFISNCGTLFILHCLNLWLLETELKSLLTNSSHLTDLIE